MPSSECHLPNGQTFTVTPVFGGVNFRSHEMNLHHSAFPPGWTVILQTNKSKEEGGARAGVVEEKSNRFTQPTLNDDSLYISYIVSPPSSDFRPPHSPSRQIAVMLWATLWWYFHEPEPDLHLSNEQCALTPPSGRPQGAWRVKIRREGIFQGRNLLQKLVRMGLIANEDSSVGLDPFESRNASSSSSSSSGENLFVSRRAFWQLDPRIFLFTLSPKGVSPLSPAALSPFPSRGGSPTPDDAASGGGTSTATITTSNTPTLITVPVAASNPFFSASHLPTYFPPPPTQYTFTNGIRHPLRPKPPHQGEVFYTRYIPSVNQYLSFRVPYLPKHGRNSASASSNLNTSSSPPPSSSASSDLEILHRWMNDPRVSAAWGVQGPLQTQETFLRDNLSSKHSFPVFGCWDGKPFGYFEIYWVKEDPLGSLLSGNSTSPVDNYDRGIHLLVGEQEFRGPHRVAIWLSALVHYCWLADLRTQTVMLEPRVDNAKVINYLTQSGFYKEGEVSFPHKQSAVMKIKREYWESPAL
ncbi:hypothetical protein ASPZODRAFT_1773713 [Penicilliopsis zonata CBS 506.65]|uniref:Acyltransferase MbtK/IucB-like conserved domain-containing protein n=1 Tax=Penicilliopsis zonata CBS 506.65 TaxID=1073090 RepID=A0A1L9SKX2_9EURO|nr:hypothetical protein ASPZODRAFT_1773713 [Penicilliopsis zonata CBS 506.65]OJJ47763.1 hypothetical protein ASPZODRAFT_1773713 [Penicilliopsis zonata CBS 506.65]